VDWWVTPSGTTVSVHVTPEYATPGDAAVYIDLTVSSTSRDRRPVTVRIDEPGYVNTLRSANGLPPLDEGARAGAA
jgi:hypothetical protein